MPWIFPSMPKRPRTYAFLARPRANSANPTEMAPLRRSGIDRRVTPAIGDPVLIRLPAVIAICALSRSCIYEGIKRGTFPAPVKLNGKPSAWIKQEVQNWINNQIQTSRRSSST